MNKLYFNPETRKWELTLGPDLMTRAKRVFAGAARGQHGVLVFSDTVENAEDLDWFLSRWDIQVEDGGHLRERVYEGMRRKALREVVASGRYKQPESFSTVVPLRPYQQEAVNLLSVMGRLLLADDLGVGKTASAIGGCTLPGSLPVVVITNTALVHQWEREVLRFLPNLKTHVIRTKQPYDLMMSRGRVKSRTPRPFPDVVITSYSKIDGWADYLGEHIKYLVCDECQELRTGTAHKVPAKYNAVKYLSTKSEFVMFLSATPIYNYGGEFYAVLDALNPGVVGTLSEFGLEWCGNNYANTAKLLDPRDFGRHLRNSGIMLRRTRSDVQRDLPPVQDIVHEIDCDPEALEAVEADCAELARRILSEEKLDRGVARDAAREFDMRLRQATGLAKAPFVAAFVRLLVEQGEPVVLFGWHRQVYEVWQDKLSDLNPVLFTGSESASQKQESVRKFMAGESKVLIMSLRSGVGLDGLQKVTRTVVYGELDYSKGVHSQCTGRVHRDGQADPVFAYYLTSDSGSDGPMLDLLGVKQAQLHGAINPEADFVSELEVDENRIRSMAEIYLKRNHNDKRSQEESRY